MMRCPFCKENNTIVYANRSKYNEHHFDYVRYRRCRSCGKTFVTHERYVPDKK